MKPVINSNTLAFETFGDPAKPAVVFIHGFPFNKKMWQPQIDALKNDYHVIIYDVRGHGESEVGDGQYTIELFVDDLIGLLDYIQLKTVVLVGLSMGGYIALRAMERHPERIRALVLCDTKSEPDANENKIRRAQQMQSIKEKGLKPFTEGFLKAVFYEKTFQTNVLAVEIIRNIILSNSVAGISGALLALAARTDTTSSLANIKVPTLVLVGDHDPLTPYASSRTLKEHIRNSELHIIPDAAHMSNLENVDEFNKHLLAFLKKVN